MPRPFAKPSLRAPFAATSGPSRIHARGSPPLRRSGQIAEANLPWSLTARQRWQSRPNWVWPASPSSHSDLR
eukprot:11191277-Lingulodinium_polyedra.AAC.1